VNTICLWSGPRNVSTALMYSFAERSDTRVVDEPLYGHFLRTTGADHPGRDEVMAEVNCDGNAVMRDLLARSGGKHQVLFLKQMAHHLVDLDEGFLRHTQNVFLIRDPREMLPSLTVQLPHASLRDTGLKEQYLLYEALIASGQLPAVVDSRELLLDPPGVIQQLCACLDIEYTADMLSWPAGPREEDGVWAPYWYHAIHKSSGFSAYVAKTEFPPHLEPLLAECSPWYEKLYDHAIRANIGQEH
jgi:sulfotransferase family protein